LVDLQSKTAWLYLLTSGLIASVIYLWQRRGRQSTLTLWRFLFPSEVFLHRSAIVDYKFVAFDLTFRAVLYSPLFAVATAAAYKVVTLLIGWSGVQTLRPGEALASTVLAPVIVFIATDFCLFFAHYLMHKVPALWPFHEVHHSAEVLTPVTVYRVHPVEELINGFVAAVILGGGAAIYSAAEHTTFSIPTLLGVNIVSFLFFTFAFHLRHSHVWLSYGPWVSRLLISPAQHQIHHSSDPKHFDKNFGFMLAIWDVVFRTLYVPRGRETLRLGVAGVGPEEYATVKDLYFRPFSKSTRIVLGHCAALMRRTSARASKRRAI
jgi:sterol desaturase/sphingolipid hydroxylase (fatty acid hydroxylase superfamily)